MATRAAQRLLIVGWDAADWQVIDPLIKQGRLPVLASLMARGIRSDLSTLEPKLSPLLWTTIATGRTPDRHGIANFVEPRQRVACGIEHEPKGQGTLEHRLAVGAALAGHGLVRQSPRRADPRQRDQQPVDGGRSG